MPTTRPFLPTIPKGIYSLDPTFSFDDRGSCNSRELPKMMKRAATNVSITVWIPYALALALEKLTMDALILEHAASFAKPLLSLAINDTICMLLIRLIHVDYAT
jgi:hypothetical protein